MAQPELEHRAGRRIPIRLLLFGAVAVGSVAVGFLTFDAQESMRLVQRFGYYTISLTFAWALVAVWRIRALLKSMLAGVDRREWLQASAVIVACVAVALATSPSVYKVLYDEMVLQATAWQIHFFRELGTVMRAYPIEGVFAPLDSYLDKRPFFFAYLLSLLHDVTGYREANAFVFNKALTFLVLGLLYLFARRVASHVAGLVAIVVFGTLSLLAHNATGAGMEMLNLAMVLLCAHFAVIYLDAPDEPRLSALVLATVLLAQTRYESSLYAGSTVLVVLEGWRRAGRLILPPAAILGPALLIPYALHNTYLSGTPLLWELRENHETRFSSEHLLPNLAHAFSYLFNVSKLMNNSWCLATAGLLSMVYVVFRGWRARAHWRTAPASLVVGLSFACAICGNLLLLMFYYWGQLDDPIVGRLSLPFQLLLTLCLAIAVQHWSAPRRPIGWWAIGGALLACLTTGFASNARHSDINTTMQEISWEQRWVDARPPGERLIITNKSSLPWLLRHTPAILNFHARRRSDALRFHLERGTFREVLVSQTFRPIGANGGFQLVPADRLPDSFVLEPMIERRVGARLCRISRLVAVRPPSPVGPEGTDGPVTPDD